MASYDDKEVTIADIPGLVEGAHKGTGLGTQFLKHIERCKTLLHLIDVNEDDLIRSYNQVRGELGKYSKKLLKKEEIVIFNKVDLIETSELNVKKKEFKRKTGKEIWILSTLEKKLVSKIKAKVIKYVS